MEWLSRLALRCIPADWRGAVERDLLDEQPAGAGSVWLARRALGIGARLRFDRSFERIRRLRSIRQVRPMHDLRRDIHFALRSAIRQPGYALAIIATLAIGIGANTAIFSVFNWIMFRPLPGAARPNELITVRYQTPKSPGQFFAPYGDYVDLRDGMRAIEGLAASLPLTVHVATGGADDGVRLEGEVVTTNYFAVMGAPPALGRSFRPEEERTLDGPPPVIISDPLWKRLFGGRRNVLGQSVRIDGDPFVVVGVAPSRFQGRSLVSPSDLWVPVGAYSVLLPHYPRDLLVSRKSTLFGDAFGRLRAGVSLEQAQTEALAVAEASPEFAVRGPNNRRSSIRPVLYAGIGHDTYAAARLRTTFALLMGAVGLVLLLACANAANLFLARTASRRREIAVRQAIGARRIHIVRQHLVEGLLLALAAGLTGIGLASWLTSLFDGMRIITFLPAIDGVQLDWRVAAFALAASLVTAVVFAAVPAVAGSRVDLLESLKDGLTSSPRGRGLLRGGLVVLQITVSLVLLVGAGLLLRTLQNISKLDLGIDTRGLVAFQLEPNRLGHDPARSQRMLHEVASALANAPGIIDAAVTWTIPFGNSRSEMAFTRPDTPAVSFDAASSAVSPGYFATMGIPIVAGRDFTETESGRLNTTDGVVILSRSLADRIFPAGGGLGARLQLDYPEKMQVQVVGIVGDVRGRPIRNDPESFAYEPAGQRWPMTWGHVVARSSLPPADITAAVRTVLRRADPSFTPPLVEPFDVMVGRALAEERLLARLSTVFAGVAALLAAIGIYAMMAGAVAERRREFGIRIALGAGSARVVRLVVRQGAVLGTIGVVFGVVGSAVLRRAIESKLFGVSAFDPMTVSLAAGATITLCVVASMVPGLRAARVDPIRSLRVE